MPVKYLTGSVYWFIVSANFFPRLLTMLCPPANICKNIEQNFAGFFAKTTFRPKLRPKELMGARGSSEFFEQRGQESFGVGALAKRLEDFVVERFGTEEPGKMYFEGWKQVLKGYSSRLDGFVLENRKILFRINREFLSEVSMDASDGARRDRSDAQPGPHVGVGKNRGDALAEGRKI